jgi:hypothetical protein
MVYTQWSALAMLCCSTATEETTGGSYVSSVGAHMAASLPILSTEYFTQVHSRPDC